METIILSQNTRTRAIERSTEALRKGKVIICPTDTIYGLIADATSDQAIRAVIEMKGRRFDKGISVIIASIEQLSDVARPRPEEQPAMERYWPGPVTILFDAKPGLSELLTGGRQTIAVRLPDHDFCRALAENLGRPLTATSANRSGTKPAVSPLEMYADLGQNAGIGLIVDDGLIEDPTPSTLIRVEKDGIRILRPGRVKIEDHD
ncbi:MAG: L-threonylcarbamoyladenylate synthase [bacterium]|nr:L-threonylcarbamoyladenylate synthase [bacterium]